MLNIRGYSGPNPYLSPAFEEEQIHYEPCITPLNLANRTSFLWPSPFHYWLGAPFTYFKL